MPPYCSATLLQCPTNKWNFPPWSLLEACGEPFSSLLPVASWQHLHADNISTYFPISVKMRETMGLLHNLGDGCRHTATAVAAWRSPRRGEIFMTAISSPRRHSSPFGDTHRHLATPIAMATPIAIWRHPSPFGDRRRQGETNRIGL